MLAVQAWVFDEAADSQRMSLAYTLRSCSHGRSRLTQQNSLVTDLVTLPCSGRRCAGVGRDRCREGGGHSLQQRWSHVIHQRFALRLLSPLCLPALPMQR